MNISTPEEVHNKVLNGAPCLKEKRYKDRCEVGRGIRQGDLYVIRVNDKGITDIKNKKGEVTVSVNVADYTMLGSDQLAIGTTMGSRHTIKESQATYWLNPTNNNSIVGGVVVAKNRWDLEHPEHAHWSMPAGCYVVLFQLDWATKQRVKD